jgi:predicted CXXCH cytochrome family protein
VHGSNRRAMLKLDGNAICSQCHETQGKFSHPVGEKIRDPRTGQMMTCVSCHNPHGTSFRHQLIMSGQKDLCTQCHQTY